MLVHRSLDVRIVVGCSNDTHYKSSIQGRRLISMNRSKYNILHVLNLHHIWLKVRKPLCRRSTFNFSPTLARISSRLGQPCQIDALSYKVAREADKHVLSLSAEYRDWLNTVGCSVLWKMLFCRASIKPAVCGIPVIHLVSLYLVGYTLHTVGFHFRCIAVSGTMLKLLVFEDADYTHTRTHTQFLRTSQFLSVAIQL
jgi:hypothetical protein